MWRQQWKKEIRSGRSSTRRYQSNHPRSVYKKEKKSVDPRWIRRPVAAWPTCLLRLVQNGKRGTNLSSTPCTLQRWPSWSGVQTLFLLSVQFSGGIISGCFSVSTCGEMKGNESMIETCHSKEEQLTPKLVFSTSSSDEYWTIDVAVKIKFWFYFCYNIFLVHSKSVFIWKILSRTILSTHTIFTQITEGVISNIVLTLETFNKQSHCSKLSIFFKWGATEKRKK